MVPGSFEDLIHGSAWIAVVEVSSVRPQATPSRYRKVASVRVITGIKGVKEGETFALEYDTGDLCPNVLYTVGERCLVFAGRMSSGHFDTRAQYWGKASMTGDEIKGLYPELIGHRVKVIGRISATSKANPR